MKIGETYHAKLGAGKPYKIHILAIVDDKEIVYKYYGRCKQWWHYGIENEQFLKTRIGMAKANSEAEL